MTNRLYVITLFFLPHDAINQTRKFLWGLIFIKYILAENPRTQKALFATYLLPDLVELLL